MPPAGWTERSPLLKGTLNSYTTVWLCHTKLTPKYRDYVAIARSQEGLSPAETVNAYQTIYFPAQKIHFERDCPQTAATAIIQNDF